MKFVLCNKFDSLGLYCLEQNYLKCYFGYHLPNTMVLKDRSFVEKCIGLTNFEKKNMTITNENEFKDSL